MRRAIWVIALVACGAPEPARDGSASSDAGAHDAAIVADSGREAGPSDAGAGDAGADAGTIALDAGPDAFAGTDAGSDVGTDAAGPRTFDVRVLADAACSDLSFDPPSIAVPAGTTFTVNWINATGCTDVDIDKNGDVPIVIGLAPGASYHDTVRSWCGSFTGTFYFRAYYAPSFPFRLDVNCSG